MSLITSSVNPRKMTATTSPWKTIDRQGLETQGLGTQGLGAQGMNSQVLGIQNLDTQYDQYEGVDRAFTSNGLFYFWLISLKT